MRYVCIAIGVSRAEGLAPLRAAATAAEEVGQWAELTGFARKEDICVLTDRTEPVTIERITQTFRRLLPIGTQTDALLLHFAGHGLREDNTRTLWLPTDWRTQLRAIAVERLKNRLSDFGIANVTIISDACKVLANDKDTSDLTPDGVLGSGISAGKRPIFDRYDATHDVEAAFMIPGPTPAESRCLFSGALIEALWGATEALDVHHPGKVTPGSLADYLSSRVSELCKTYRLNCEPQCLPGRPPDHLIYFDQTQVNAALIPSLPAWPRPAFESPVFSVDVASTAAPQRRVEKDAFDSPERAAFGIERFSVGGAANRRRWDAIDAFDVYQITHPDEANLFFGGGQAKAIWSTEPVHRVAQEQWLVDIEGNAQQLLVECDGGVFVPLLVYRRLITVAVRDARGVNGWLFCSPTASQAEMFPAIDILQRMQSGNLPPSEVDKVVAELRVGKHINPMVGAICAYLYDYVGDLDSIRRMAFFYAHYRQPIPYDIALMGELRVRNRGLISIAEVPAVEARPFLGKAEVPDFVTRATRAEHGEIGGLCPWLRQGWDFVDAPTDHEKALVASLSDIRKHLLPETFTSLDQAGGRKLTELWRMRRWE